MAILKLPPRPLKNEILQIRVGEEIKANLHKCAEFMNSSEPDVLSKALKLPFHKDEEFKAWVEVHPRNDDQPQTGGGSRFESVMKT